MQLAKGANAPLPGTAFRVSLAFDRSDGGHDVDVSAYMLKADGRVRGDGDMIFYNQPASADGAIRFDKAAGAFDFDLSRVDPAIERIAICVVVDGGRADALGAIMLSTSVGPEFRHDTTGAAEAAVIVGEVYLRAGQWKLRAVGQGFAGGLAPLARSFGMDVEDDAPAAGSPSTAPPPIPPTAPQAPSAPSAPPVSLKKVTLEKGGGVNLRKGGGAIRATLEWKGRYAGDGDLDFYCFYVLKDGTCGKVYWNDMGARSSAPFITLSGDSQAAGSEEIVIHEPERIRFALFAAYSAVANGTGAFKTYRPAVTLRDVAGNEVTIPLLNPSKTSYWVAISHIAVGDEIAITHVEKYGVSAGFLGASGHDAERSPILRADGTWEVSKGPIEFKT